MPRRSFFIVILGWTLTFASGAFAGDLQGSGALLQGLDKVTARISPIHAPVGEVVRFGTLEIAVRRCLKR